MLPLQLWSLRSCIMAVWQNVRVDTQIPSLSVWTGPSCTPHLSGEKSYHNDLNYSNRHARANCIDPNHTAPRSLHTCTVWSVFTVCIKKLWVLGCPQSTSKDSDQTNGQANLRLCWERMLLCRVSCGIWLIVFMPVWKVKRWKFQMKHQRNKPENQRTIGLSAEDMLN